MPRVFRVMKKDDDGFPRVSPTDLGVRPVDVDIDDQDFVILNGKGMSVAPNWRDININRIPKRPRPIMPGGGGANNSFCFRMGNGPFEREPIAKGLILVPDSATHANIAPEASVALAIYHADLAATRVDWQIDEA